MSNHAVWPTSDGAYCVTTDEREGGALRLYELVDNGSSVTINPRDSYQASIGESFSAHNPVILGDRIYTSWYQTGGLVFQIDRTSHTLQLVGSYDTSTLPVSFFEGNWGAYPLTGEESVLLSDIETGMYVVDFSAVQIAFTAAREDMIEVGAAQSVTVEISNLGNVAANTGSVTLMASVNGGAYQAIPMGSIGGGQYQADLPQLNCNSSVNYYVQVDDLSGGTWTNPATAPAETYVAYSRGATTLTILNDTFQTDLGWSVTNNSVSAGAWERGNPVGTGGQAESGDPDETGARCFVTGLSATSIGSNDLDGGPTTLTSPVLDFSAGDGLIRYSRWFFNDDGDGDTLQVQISNNNGSSWTTVETVDTQKGGGWVKRSLRVSDFVNPTANVRMRFTASDQPNSSITEAGVDAFQAIGFNCASAAVAQVRLGTNVNPAVYTSTSLPIISMDWTSEIDASGVSGANLTYILGMQLALDPGVPLAFGELLVDLGSEPLITNPLAPAGNGVASHLLPVPNDSSLQGLEVFTQGVIFGPGTVVLTNAIDIVVEY